MTDIKQSNGVREYKGTKYRIVSEFRGGGGEWFGVEFRRWFVFFPYWQRWDLFHGNAFYGSTERQLFETPEKAEKAFLKKVDEVTYKSLVVVK